MTIKEWFFGRDVDWMRLHLMEEDLAATKSALHDTEQQLAATLRQLEYCNTQNDCFAEAFGKLMENYWEERGP